MLLHGNEINTILNSNLNINEGYVEYIDRIHSMLKEPLLYIKVADKRIILESIREVRHNSDVILKNFEKWNKTNKTDLLDRINYEVMHLVYKFRDVHHYFIEKTGSDAYINIKVEEWRKYIRSCSTKLLDELKMCLDNYKNKLDIDFELQQIEYIEKLSVGIK